MFQGIHRGLGIIEQFAQILRTHVNSLGLSGAALMVLEVYETYTCLSEVLCGVQPF